MTIYTCDPLDDERWAQLAETHPASSAFHTVAWLDALRRTYAYEPIVYTTTPPGSRLANGIVLCKVRSWLTGRRMVSLPFADHCDPLVEGIEERAAILGALHTTTPREWKYVELRPTSRFELDGVAFREAESFRFHMLDLRPPADDIFKAFHASSIQRKIRRAEREGVRFEQGRSEKVLREFYRLMLLTRRRHGLPPQPIDWFRNVLACFGERSAIRVASAKGRAIAAILTLRHRDTLVYRYGCSDAGAHPSGAMPSLFWTAIQEEKANGVQRLDLGRSESANSGLTSFKERLGGTPSTITYVRSASTSRARGPARHSFGMPPQLVARLPDRLLTAAGSWLYRHMG